MTASVRSIRLKIRAAEIARETLKAAVCTALAVGTSILLLMTVAIPILTIIAIFKVVFWVVFQW